MVERLVLLGTTSSNFLDVRAAAQPYEIRALRGNDTVFGTAFDDLIDGGAGHDDLFGAAGNDIFSISGTGNGDDLVDGGAGSDLILGSGGDDRIQLRRLNIGHSIEAIDGAGGTDVVVGTTSNNWLDFSGTQLTNIGLIDADRGNDQVIGSAAADFIKGGPGHDTLTGGGGVDTAVFSGSMSGYNVSVGASRVVVSDLVGGDGTDYLFGFSFLQFSDTTFDLTGGGSNRPPVALDDQAVTARDVPVSINVLANDSDPDGDNLAVTSFTQPANGTVTRNADGTLRYAPDSGFTGADGFTYVASDGTSTETAGVSVQVGGTTPPPGGLRFSEILAAAPEEHWVRVNTNHFRDVWTPFLQRANGGNKLPDAVVGAWSSMAWDSARGDLLFWGGGHANYPGNEIYRWRSSTLEWERASLPSEVKNISGSRFEAIDGYLNAPISSHTYDNSEYLPIVDRFIVFGGAAFNTGGGFVRTDGVTPTGPYLWDPSKADANKVGGTTGSHVNPDLFPNVVGGEMWDNRDNRPNVNLVNGTSAYAEEDGKDVLYIGRTELWKYTIHDINDPSRDTHEQVGRTWEPFGGDGAGAYSPDLEVFVRTARNKFVMWDLENAGPDNLNASFVPQVRNGSFDFSDLADYGMDYDPVRDVFVLWGGDSRVWQLTPPDQLSTSGWTLEPLPSAAFNQAPDNANSTVGVFGKWKYVAEQDIFIGVNDSSNGDVWIYKPDDWSPGGDVSTVAVADATQLQQAPAASAGLADLVDWPEDVQQGGADAGTVSIPGSESGGEILNLADLVSDADEDDGLFPTAHQTGMPASDAVEAGGEPPAQPGGSSPEADALAWQTLAPLDEPATMNS